MPLSYADGHPRRAQGLPRRRAVAFDVSHLGTVRVEGPGALERLQAALTNDLAKVAPGRAQYTHLLDEADASVLDDIIVWWLADDVLRRHAERVEHRAGRGRHRGRRRHRHPGRSSRSRARRPGAPRHHRAGGRGHRAVPRREADVAGVRCTVAGTGYTGEDGVELAVPADAGPGRCGRPCWARASTPAGLGARDTLRLEAALPLHGHELGPGITPLQAGLGLGRRVGQAGRVPGPRRPWSRAGAGRGPSAARPGRRGPPPARGPIRRCWSTASRRARSPAATSRRCSGHGIALAFLPPEVEEGAEVAIDVRATRSGDGGADPVRRPQGPTELRTCRTALRPCDQAGPEDRASTVGGRLRTSATQLPGWGARRWRGLLGLLLVVRLDRRHDRGRGRVDELRAVLRRPVAAGLGGRGRPLELREDVAGQQLVAVPGGVARRPTRGPC